MRESEHQASAPPRRKWQKRITDWVRKTHMYLGLFLFPWVVFFGASGMLFNHPGIGEDDEPRPVPAELLHDKTGLSPVDLGALAREVTKKLGSYRLDSAVPAELHGSLGFSADGQGRKHLFLVDLPSGRGLVLSRPDRTPKPAPFAGEVEVDGVSLDAIEQQVSGLLPALGIRADGPLVKSAGLTPSLRFVVLDERGQRWNVTYDLGSGHVDGRPREQKPSLSLHDVLGNLHKTHHFPVRLGPTTFWALFADLTGLTLMLWALTGIVMWWQFKRARAAGLVVVSTGLLIAALVMVSTDGEIRFGNVRPEGPGAKK